jgi:hypothetical protein
MNVDFGAGMASLDGRTPSSIIRSTDIISVDTFEGTFSELHSFRLAAGDFRGITIDIDIHGKGATGVTGVYAEHFGFPEFFGVIVGRRATAAGDQ